MSLISGGWGLSLLGAAVHVAAYGLVMWTFARSHGLGDEFVQGVRSLPSVLWNGLLMVGTPGGGR